MKYLVLILFLSGCTPVITYLGESFSFLEDENKVLHCWIERDDNRAYRYCEKEEGFQ